MLDHATRAALATMATRHAVEAKRQCGQTLAEQQVEAKRQRGQTLAKQQVEAKRQFGQKSSAAGAGSSPESATRAALATMATRHAKEMHEAATGHAVKQREAADAHNASMRAAQTMHAAEVEKLHAHYAAKASADAAVASSCASSALPAPPPLPLSVPAPTPAASSSSAASPQPSIKPDGARAGMTAAFLKATRQERNRFNALVVRQLLAKHGLLAKMRAITDFIARRRGDPARTPAALASEFGFASLEDAAMIALFFGDSMGDTDCHAFTQQLLRLPDAAVEATAVLHLRDFLSNRDIQNVFEAAKALCKADSKSAALPSGTNGAKAATSAPDVQYGAAHVALNLHRAGHFQRSCPRLCAKITDAMRSQSSMFITPQITLSIRCIEFHTYTAGDGLATRGHRDLGSVLTISVLLSDPHSVEGGTFMTCDRASSSHEGLSDGVNVPHAVSRGGAVLFHSEKMHNVAPVSKGVRHSLVIELWMQPENKFDRHK